VSLRGGARLLGFFQATRDVIVFALSVAYDTGISLLESGHFLLVFIVVMVVLMVTGWRRNKPTI